MDSANQLNMDSIASYQIISTTVSVAMILIESKQ